MYKAGQLITINDKVYRVHRESGAVCHLCAFKHMLSYEKPCADLCMNIMPGKSKLPYGYYLKPIKSCGT